MAEVDDDRMRAELQKLLQGVSDLGSMSIGKLRASLEEALGLESGALNQHKDQVNKVLQEELVKKVQGAQAAEEKKRKAEAAKDSGGKKKDKKDKKDKKEKKAKKAKEAEDAEGSDDALEAEDAEEAAAPVETPAPAAAEAPAEAAAAAEEVGNLLDDFATPQKKSIARLQTWAVSGGEDGNVRLWDLENYSCVRVLEGHMGAVHALAVDWDDMQAVSGAQDNVKLWSLKRGGCQRTFSEVEEGCAAVTADWKKLQSICGCGDGNLKLWNMTTGELISSVFAHVGGVWAIEADWNARRIASGGDNEFKIWNINDWTCLSKVEGHPGGIMCLAMDWVGQRTLVGVGAAEQSLRLWDLETRKPRNLLGHRDAVAHLKADWEGDFCLSGGWDAQLRFWNFNKGTCVMAHECKFGRIRSMCVDFAQMQAVCGSSAGTLHFVDLHTGLDLRKLEGHIGGVTALQVKF